MIFRFFFWIALFVATSSHAYIYNDSLLLIYAKIVPKVMALDHTVRQNDRESKRLCILYEKGDQRIARELVHLIEKNMEKNGKKRIRVMMLSYRESARCTPDVSALLLLKTHAKNIKRALEYAQRNHLLTFAYDRAMLNYGATISIYTGKKVYPVINIEAVKKSGLRLDPFLLQIAKVYDGDAS